MIAAARGGAAQLQHEGGPYEVFATRIPKPLHRALKSHCVILGTSVMDFVANALQEKLARSSGAPAKRWRGKA